MALSNTLKADPTRTLTLRKQFMADMKRRIKRVERAVKEAVVEQDVFGLTETPIDPLNLNQSTFVYNVERQAWKFQTSEKKIDSFNRWLQEQMDANLLSLDGEGNPWTAKHVNSAYRKGMVRAYTDTHKEALAADTSFYAGGKDQFMMNAFAQPETLSKVRLLATRNYELLKGFTQTAGQQLNFILANALVNGNGAQKIARDMTSRLQGLTKQRAMTIARTEVIYAHAEGQLDSYELLGVEEVGVMAEWSTAGDDRVCSLCAELEGATLTIDEARGLIPRHPNCVTGDSKILAASPLTLFRGYYTGKIIEIVTAKGCRLSVTENHVLLTDRGWVRAKELLQTDQLFNAPGVDREVFERPDDHHAVSSIRDIYTSFLEGGCIRTQTSTNSRPEDFHGDGSSFHEKIDIVSLNSILRDQFQRLTFGQFVKPLLMKGHFRGAASFELMSKRALSAFLVTAAASADSSMGFDSVRAILLRGSLAHHQLVSSDLPSDRNSSSFKPSFDQIASVSECLRKLIKRDSADVIYLHLLKHFAGYRDASSRNDLRTTSDRSKFAESYAQCFAIAADLFSSVSDTFASLVDKKSFVYDGIDFISSHDVVDLDVYDVETKESAYIVNGIVSSNCRCTFIPSINSKQKATSARERIKKSIKAEKPKATLKEAKASSTWAGKETTIKKR